MSATLCSELPALIEATDRLVSALEIRSNVAYSSDKRSGSDEYNRNCESAVRESMLQVAARAKDLSFAARMNVELRVPFAASEFVGDGMLRGAFMDHVTVSFLERHNPTFATVRKSQVGRFAVVATEDVRNLVRGASDSRNSRREE